MDLKETNEKVFVGILCSGGKFACLFLNKWPTTQNINTSVTYQSFWAKIDCNSALDKGTLRHPTVHKKGLNECQDSV